MGLKELPPHRPNLLGPTTGPAPAFGTPTTNASVLHSGDGTEDHR